MEIHKLKQALLIICIGCLCCGCSSEKEEENKGFFTQLVDIVPWIKKESTEVEKDPADFWEGKYWETKGVLKLTQEDVVKNKIIIAQTLNELREISAMAGIVRQGMREGSVKESPAEEIQTQLKAIREKVEAMESDSTHNVVASLKTILEEKEREIEALKREIKAQQRKIKEKDGTINNLEEELRRRIEELEVQNGELQAKTTALESARRSQVDLLWQAGRNFENLGNKAPDVSGRKDNKKVEEWMRECFEMAKFYYLKAQDNGREGVSADLDRINKSLSKPR